MIRLDNVRKGDEVEVTIKGTVKEVSAERIDIHPADPKDRTYWLTFLARVIDRIEVIKRALPKVGDTIKGAEAALLPVGTVLRNTNDVPEWGFRFRSTNGWIFTGGGLSYLAPSDRYTIEYLPES